MVAMLGFHPLRRKNFAALEIGRSLVKIRGSWWIVLSAAETKENRADERRVNKMLIPFIDRYLDQYRPVLIRPDSPPYFWLSSRHAARIADKHVSRLIGATTLSTVGVKLSPHLFRTSAASARRHMVAITLTLAARFYITPIRASRWSTTIARQV
jgi:Site-specific recombinase XerD